MLSDSHDAIKDKLLLLFSILSGLLVGMFITFICIHYKLAIYGVNLDLFIAPIAAGFVETVLSKLIRNRSSGAISAIILFFITNGIGWLFPSQPLSFNIFTVGGFLLMVQAAFPLMMNYLIIGILFLFTYFFGLAGSFIGYKINPPDQTPMNVSDIDSTEKLDVYLFNSKPNVPIREYHGLVFAEDVVDFDDKTQADKLKYLESDIENKNLLNHHDYTVARKYILHNLQKEALKINANAIIDMEFEYTNYNQQFPPDVVIAAYGTAVIIDEKYL